jgi:hypothetical protein
VTPAVLCLILLLVSPQQESPVHSDTERIGDVFATASAQQWNSKPMGDIVAGAGRMFIGARYEAGTLDRSAHEELVVNLHSFDCTTFLETSLAIARCIRNGHRTMESFSGELGNIRYREGVRSGYSSRLHYMLEWISDNAAKKFIRDITAEIGGVAVRRTISYMTAHRRLYPALAADTTFTALRRTEERLSQHRYFLLPAGRVRQAQQGIMTGDLIMITTSQAGLDVRHAGIAIREPDGGIRLLHASETAGTVQISGETLPDYLAKHRWATGIVILRPLPPA